MSNLRGHQTNQLLAALKLAKAGDITECLEICYELRLHPSLDLDLRVIIANTICDLTTPEQNPGKNRIANESVRIAKELAEVDPAFNDLVEEAQRCLNRVIDEDAASGRFANDKAKTHGNEQDEKIPIRTSTDGENEESGEYFDGVVEKGFSVRIPSGEVQVSTP